MIKIEKLSCHQKEEVRKVELAQEQIKFAGTAEEFLLDDCETTHLHVIKYQEHIVGFFKLDVAYSDNYEFCPSGAIGLRAFAVDKNYQGKGLGTKAVVALLAYLKENYASYHSIYLTVNCKNPRAFSCYQKAGFEDTQLQYLGGEAGPQHIMCAAF